MPKFKQLKNSAQKSTQKAVNDVKSKLDDPMDKAWSDITDASKGAARNVRDEAKETVSHNLNKEYKKEVSQAKQKLVEARDDARQDLSDLLDKKQDSAEQIHQAITTFDVELENNMDHLVVSVTNTTIDL